MPTEIGHPKPADKRPTPPSPPRLLDRVRGKIRLKHYSIRTEEQYANWIKRFILFHGKKHPESMGAPEVEAFLTNLAVEGKVAASTQNQARSAILFLYREVLGHELAWLENVEQAKAPKRLPVVLTPGRGRGCADANAELPQAYGATSVWLSSPGRWK